MKLKCVEEPGKDPIYVSKIGNALKQNFCARYSTAISWTTKSLNSRIY